MSSKQYVLGIIGLITKACSKYQFVVGHAVILGEKKTFLAEFPHVVRTDRRSEEYEIHEDEYRPVGQIARHGSCWFYGYCSIDSSVPRWFESL